MSELFSFFSPKLTKKTNLKTKSAVTADDEQKEEEAYIFDGRLTGIVNDNYDSFEEDDESVETLSVALFHLEEKKKSLEEEIDNLYKSEIGYDDMMDIIARILSTSRVAIPSTIEDDDIADIDDCFEMLKSTALFVEKRLRKIKLKPKPETKIFQEIDFENEIVENIDNLERDESKHDKVEIVDNLECDEIKDDKVEIVDNLECDESKDDKNCDLKDATHEVECPIKSEEDSNREPGETDVKSNSSGDIEETLGTKRVSYEDFVDNIDVKDTSGKDALAAGRFGPQKTRWSLRRVFKKKNSR